MALLYSVRLRRWTEPALPGFGAAAHARSRSVSNEVAIERYVAASGRGIPGGGIIPDRSFTMTCSHSSASAAGFVASRPSSLIPAIAATSLWQTTQYCSSISPAVRGADAAS